MLWQKLKCIHFNYILIFCLILTVVPRIILITADTPVLQLFTDEGFKTFDARNKAVTGDWHISPHPPCYLYLHPTFTLILYGFFKLFGVGYVQARLVSVLFSIGVVFLIFLIMKKYLNLYWAALAAVFAALNFYFIMMSRTAVIEIMALFFMMATVYFVINGSERWINYFISGIIFIIAMVTKLYAAFLLPAILFALIKHRDWRGISRFLIGSAFAFIIYLIFWYFLTETQTLFDVLRLNVNIAKLEIFRIEQAPAITSSDLNNSAYPDFHIVIRLINGFFRRIIYVHHLFILAPVLFILALTYFLSTSSGRKALILNTIMVNWLIIGLALLLAAQYASIHHLIILFPPLIVLSTFEFQQFTKTDFDNLKNRSLSRTQNVTRIIVIGIIFHQVIFAALMILLKGFIEKTAIINPIADFNPVDFLWTTLKSSNLQSVLLLPRVNAYELWRVIGTVLSFFLTIVSYLIFSRISRFKSKRIYLALLILFIVINFGRYIDWIRNARFTEINTSRQLGKLVSQSDILIGGQFLALENNIFFAHHHEDPAVYMPQATHLFELIYHPLEGLQAQSTHLNKKFVQKFYICDHIYHLYKFSD